MVTRVDKKPIIYGTTMARVLRNPIQMHDRKTIECILYTAKGAYVPKVKPREVIEDLEDIEYEYRFTGLDERYMEQFFSQLDDQDDECIRLARVCLDRSTSRFALRKQAGIADAATRAVYRIIRDCVRVYFGTEAVYQLYNQALIGNVFAKYSEPDYVKWALETTRYACLYQSAYLFIHPSAIKEMTAKMERDMGSVVRQAWVLYKRLETLALRIGSKKNLAAHAYHSGVSKSNFEPSVPIEMDFELPVTGFAQGKDDVKMYSIAGIRYIIIGGTCYCLTGDDSINLASMAQCYFRTAIYFTVSNGYTAKAQNSALALITDIVGHACRLIDSGKNFSHIIRSMHILAQGDFNDIYEEAQGSDLGWRERSENYRREADELDVMGKVFHKRALALASDRADILNVGFIYHALIGDEMMINDLRSKVKGMSSKVLDADEDEWSRFIKFVKSYMICRYMKCFKRKPKAGGDLRLLNDEWASKCIRGRFTMPPQADWGKVWIKGEFAWTAFADYWHLEAQDVAYVEKDSKGILDGSYRTVKGHASELIMAMTHGHILDLKEESTPQSARARIKAGVPAREVVLTTAPKAENAKPSWKKRVTFAADCEFRKMQAEYDRNCRRVMSFVRGPSLGIDQVMLEKQFADICGATSTGIRGAICSHDISAWSESMDRGRKFEFESILVDTLTEPTMVNIAADWQQIKAVVNKAGCKDAYPIPNGSFQGFDGSASTILHSMILIYCIDTARRKDLMDVKVTANMATLIDDCVALMNGLDDDDAARAFWAHLKDTYRKLGFEVDELKSIFSTIKAIYLSRRFLTGAEVPADMKVFIKAHVSYEDPLRCAVDVFHDIFGATRGAADANGDPWYIYFTSAFSALMELCHQVPDIRNIPSAGAAVFALAPISENGWGMPSIIDWATNDVTDKRAHFNAIFEKNAVHKVSPEKFQGSVDVLPYAAQKALYAIKSQAWRIVSSSSIFTNPFDALREGPMKPDMLKRNAVSDLLKELAIASPWDALLAWNNSSTTNRVRELLINSGPLHAPTLSALVNCMPDNYRLSLVGKAIGSNSVLDMLPRGMRVVLKRRVHRCASHYFAYSLAIFRACHEVIRAGDYSSLNYVERTVMEREAFYTANGVTMTDHTFPDPVGSFTRSISPTQSVISPNSMSIRIWDRLGRNANRVSQLMTDKGLYVPKKSGRVWEITSEYAKGWDSVSQRIAMGMAVLARAESDGHEVSGLQSYFIKSWNEMSNITPEDTRLISIHGAIKRLDSNPGSSVHPIIICKNILRGFNNQLTSALNAIPFTAKKKTGSASHLHDLLAHDTCMRGVTALHFVAYQFLGSVDGTLQFHMAMRPDCVIPESDVRMTTNSVVDMIEIEIMDSADDYGLLQACPSLAVAIAIPTMRSSWVNMINALVDGRHGDVEELKAEAAKVPLDELIEQLKIEEAHYSTSVILAEPPAERQRVMSEELVKYSVAPTFTDPRMEGDSYTTSVNIVPSKFSRSLTFSQPEHIVSAVAIKSVVWSRLKLVPADGLAKILYHDPDAVLDPISHTSKADFWRAVITEVSKLKGKHNLSNVVMSGFRSLGVPGVHIVSSNDVQEVTQSVASYFGAHLEEVTRIISSEIMSIAGRSSEAFERPILERVITNNPAVMNAKLRKEHIRKIIDVNIRTLEERIKRIMDKNVVHRGDKRATQVDEHARVVELRCRRYAYQAAVVAEDGSARVDLEVLAVKIGECGNRVCKRCEAEEPVFTSIPKTVSGIKSMMEAFEASLNTTANSREHGWDPISGMIGIRYVIQTVNTDSKHVLETRFAVTAAEVAPRIHKRVVLTHAGTPIGLASDEEGLEDVYEGGSTLGSIDLDDFMTWETPAPIGLNIELWKALYTLVFCGAYEASKVNGVLGTDMSSFVSPSSIREAHLEDFGDDVISAAFPSVIPDYLSCGSQFDEEWLDMAEADAYLDDEVSKSNLGYLF